MAKDEMVEWHHQLNEHEFKQAPEVSEGQQSLVCYSSWGHRVGHQLATEQQQHSWYSERLMAETTRPIRRSNKPAEDIHTTARSCPSTASS